MEEGSQDGREIVLAEGRSNNDSNKSDHVVCADSVDKEEPNLNEVQMADKSLGEVQMAETSIVEVEMAETSPNEVETAKRCLNEVETIEGNLNAVEMIEGNLNEVGKRDEGLNEVETIEKDLNEAELHEGASEGKKDKVEVENSTSDKRVDDNVVEKINGSCPRVGMEFNSQEEAYDFYSCYGIKKGFRIRKNSTCRSQRRRKNEIIGRNFVCSRQGVKESRIKGTVCTRKERAEYRTGCKAYMSLRRRNGNKWVVSKFLDEHNHDMESSIVIRKVQSQKSAINDEMIEKMCLAGFKINPMVTDMTPEVGGNRSVVSIKRDGINVLATKRQTELKKEDVEAILNYLEKQQLENLSFFYSVQVDSEGQMTNFFWADSKSRMDYHHFGDVVFFDPAYKTNRVGLQFIPILGINHHYQMVLFGSALLCNESEESFQWLTRTWIRAMNGKEPKVILTDYDSVVGEAINRVLPSSCHLFCSRKIIQDAKKNLADVINVHEGFIHDFANYMSNSENVNEFETNWGMMLEQYGLGDNNWLMELFEKRGKWVSVYSCGTFLPTMFTNQHTEGMNIYFGDCFKEDMPLSEFVKHFEKSVMDKREKENDAESESNYRSPSLRFSTDIEKEAANIYTKEIFQKFQDQMFEGISYCHKKVAESGNMSTYSVWKTGHEETVRSVTFDYSSMSAKCSCKFFESAGYLCRHILKIFLVENVQNLSPKYVLKRWTKDAKFGSVVNDEGEIMQPTGCENVAVESVTGLYKNLCQEAINIAAKGSASVEAYKVAIRCLHNTVKEVEAAIKLITGPSACNTKVGGQNKHNTTQGHLEKSSENKKTPIVPSTVKYKGRSKTLKPRSDKLPVKKMSATQKMRKDAQNVVSSHISFATTNEIPHDPQQKRRKFGQSSQSTVAVENDQLERPIQAAALNPIGYQPEEMVSHLYYQPSARELEFHTLSHASPATIGQDLGHITQSYFPNDTQPFSLVSPSQQFHCSNQDSSVVKQTFSMTPHETVITNSSYLKAYQFGQGSAPPFVLRPQQSQGNANIIDLNGPNRDLS